MHFVGIPLRNLRRRPLRSILTALGVAAAVASLLTMVGVSRGVEGGWVNVLKERGTHIIAVRKGTANILTGGIPADLEGKLSRVEGVHSVYGELIDMAQVDEQNTTLVAGWATGSPLWKSVRIQGGRVPHEGEMDVALIGQSIAEAMKKKLGDRLTIRQQSFTVIGIFRQGGAMGNHMIVLPLPKLQELMGVRDRVTGFSIQVSRPDDPQWMADMIGRLTREFSELSFSESKDAAERDDILKLLRAFAWAVSVVALAMAAVVVMNTLLMSVTERTREIGILSALGWSRGRILGMIVLEGLLLTTAGSLLGSVLGLGSMTWLSHHPRLRGFMDLRLSFRMITDVCSAAILLGLISSVYPAWRAIQQNIVEAIRWE
jgi:putative ABC transport system permease protein